MSSRSRGVFDQTLRLICSTTGRRLAVEAKIGEPSNPRNTSGLSKHNVLSEHCAQLVRPTDFVQWKERCCLPLWRTFDLMSHSTKRKVYCTRIRIGFVPVEAWECGLGDQTIAGLDVKEFWCAVMSCCWTCPNGRILLALCKHRWVRKACSNTSIRKRAIENQSVRGMLSSMKLRQCR